MKKMILTFVAVSAIATFSFPCRAQAADDSSSVDTSTLAPPSLLGGAPGAEGTTPSVERTDLPAPALDLINPDVAANHADLSIDSLVLPSAQEAEQDATLDQAFAAVPLGTGETGGGGAGGTVDAVIAKRLAAIQDSAQEAATLGYGAPVNFFGTEKEHGHEGRTHEEAGCFEIFHDLVSGGFGALTQGLGEGSLPPEVAARFEAMHERFEQLAQTFQTTMFGGAGDLPGGIPGVGTPMMGPEGAAMMPVLVNFQDMGTVLGAAMAGMDTAKFAEGMSQMMQARQEAFQANFDPAAAGEHGTLPDFGALPFGGGPGFGPEGASFAAFAGVAGGSPENASSYMSPELVAQVTQQFSQEISQSIAQQITQNIVQQTQMAIIQQNLPPEALNVINALNTNFTAADLATLAGGAPSISRAFSADITDRYKNDQGVSVDMPGQEHIHVTYTLTGGAGDGLVPIQHVDAQVTAIHSQDHTQTAQLPAEAAHIPGIEA